MARALPVPFRAVLLLAGIVVVLRLAPLLPGGFLLFQPDLLAATLFLYTPFLHYRRGRGGPAWIRAGGAKTNAWVFLSVAAGGAAAFLLFLALPLPPALRPVAGPVPPLGEFLFRQALFAALPEEVFFRGYVYDACEEGGWPPVLSSSLLFAAAHLALMPSFYRALTVFPGFLFGWARRRTGNVYVPILLHLLFNLFPYLAAGGPA